MERRHLERHYYEALRVGRKLNVELGGGSRFRCEPVAISFRSSHYVLRLRDGGEIPIAEITSVTLDGPADRVATR